MEFPNFIGGTYQAESLDSDAQDCINLYPELVESGSGRNKLRYQGTPGKHTFTTLPTAPLRGLWAGDNRLFAVGGSKLYEVFSDGTYTDLGDVGDDSDHTPVEMFPNGAQLFIVSSDQAYIHDGISLKACKFDGFATVNTTSASNSVVTWVSGDHFDPTANAAGKSITINGAAYTVLTYTDTTHITLTTNAGAHTGALTTTGAGGGLVTARTGAFLDTFFVAALADSKTIFISASNDGSSWDPADVGTKEGYPDNIASIVADHEELYMFGNETSEVWRNEGNPDFPFQRDPGAFLHEGIVGIWSRTRLEGNLFLLSGDARGRIVAIQLQGFMPKRVSTHAIEKKWATYSRVDDASAYGYVENGHSFWVISFPTADATWVYDATTGVWHKRAWWSGSALHRDRARCHAYVFGKHFVGDWENGKIYEQSTAFYDDFGADIQRVRRAPYVHEEEKRVAHHCFKLDLEVGGGTLTAALKWSDDFGHNYNTARSRSATSGDYNERLQWWRLGESRHRIYDATITGQQKIAINNALLELTVAAH